MTEADIKKRAEEIGQRACDIQIRDDVCSRSAMAALAEAFDFITDDMVKGMASLAGGCGSASGSCGAYCAGLMAVGIKYNSTIDEELSHPGEDRFGPKTAAHFTEYRERFKAEMGSILCPKIHEKVFGRAYQLDDPKEAETFLTMPGHEAKCGEVVRVAARIAAEMILADK